MELPPIILVKTESADKCLLLSTSRIDQRKLWKFDIIENPSRLVMGGIWNDDSMDFNPRVHLIEHLRDGGARRPKIIGGKIWFTGIYLNVHGSHFQECVFSNPNNTLPDAYLKVATGCDHEQKWHFRIGDAPILIQQEEERHDRHERHEIQEPVTHSIPNIPVHIFHTFVDLAIQKREECPITREPLTRANVAGTPCGHLFTYESILSAIQYNSKCPTCRSPLTPLQIQRW
jgi:hypothetical protein